MALEIERKFLVNTDQLKLPEKGEQIMQGYIPTEGKTVVRARVKGEKAYLTLKGSNKGAVRSEFEYEIPVQDAVEIMDQLCQGPKVEKVRYVLTVGKHEWEVDVFEGDNQGLVVAEVELSSEDETVELPGWVTEEVTGQVRYYNSSLLDYPYCRWGEGE